MNTVKIVEVLKKIAAKIEEEKEFLTELDSPIGDSDHGINMARGFAMVSQKLDEVNTEDTGDILRNTGMALVSTVGGSSGPLYGTAFMKMGMALKGKAEVSVPEFLQAFEAGIEGIKARGKSTTGEKTMLDAMVPALDAMKAEWENSGDKGKTFATGVKAAQKGVEYTKTIIATKGRASYVGERSIGHQDPGATSFTMMLEVLAEEV